MTRIRCLRSKIVVKLALQWKASRASQVCKCPGRLGPDSFPLAVPRSARLPAHAPVRRVPQVPQVAHSVWDRSPALALLGFEAPHQNALQSFEAEAAAQGTGSCRQFRQRWFRRVQTLFRRPVRSPPRRTSWSLAVGWLDSRAPVCWRLPASLSRSWSRTTSLVAPSGPDGTKDTKKQISKLCQLRPTPSVRVPRG